MTSDWHFGNHFLMETILSTEEDFEGYDDKIPAGNLIIHFKMVGVGPKTQEANDYTGTNICQVVRQQPGFFILSDDVNGLRKVMHDFVDRFCDSQED